MAKHARALDIAQAVNSDELASLGVLYPLIVRCAIMIEDYADAEEYLKLAFPMLDSDLENPVNRFNGSGALLLAFVKQQRGDNAAADRLLEQVLELANSLPRTGFWGQGLLDVRALSLQGRPSAAVDAFRAAIDDGVVSAIPFDFWEVDDDPTLALLRQQPQYPAMRAEMAERIEFMESRLKAATDANDWSDLLSLAGEGLQASTR